MRWRVYALAIAAAFTFPLWTAASHSGDIQNREPVEAPGFTLRANPRWIDQINAVLATIGDIAEAEIPSGASVSEYLASRCGGHVPRVESTAPTAEGRLRIRFVPCLRIVRNARIKAVTGSTLEGIAVRNGLTANAASSLEIKPEGSNRARPDPDMLYPGDVVVVPRLPLWTDVTIIQPAIATRTAFIAALAKAVGCEGGSAEECLVQRGVLVLDRATAPGREQAPIQIERGRTTPFGMRRAPVPSVLLAAAPLLVRPVPARTSVVPPPISVAEGQWPYDVMLLAAILRDAAASIRHRAVIGVADGGLATRTGTPLPSDAFDDSREDPPEPDDLDDDENEFVDDLFGGGVLRRDELVASGDVSLCHTGQPPFSTWAQESLSLASHGSVVASVAAALRVRAVVPDAGRALPKIAFFRMLESACGEQANFRAADAEMVKAFDYLERRADIINISYVALDSAGSPSFVNAVKATLVYGEKLLVLSAGNDTPGNLDMNPMCPPCLGSNDTDKRTANRTLVVGAATQELRRASFSNFGARTVGIFAPGEAPGTLNIAGGDASSSAPATSYAAPYVALAAAIIRSFGADVKALDIKDRLAAATWPLDDGADPALPTVGVLDVVKAAAVRHHAIEVLEPAANGRRVRRTYVGRLTSSLEDLPLCAGQPFFESAVHAIRLSDDAADGERWVHAYKRNDFLPSGRRRIKTFRCRPQGTVRIRTLSGEDKAFPLTVVTHIQLPWVRGN